MDDAMNARLTCLQLAQKIDEANGTSVGDGQLVRSANTFYEFVYSGTVPPADEN